MSEPTNDLDSLLAVILGSCLEAYCEDCGQILASGTKVYHNMVSSLAYHHGETYDHDVHVRSWADLTLLSAKKCSLVITLNVSGAA